MPDASPKRAWKTVQWTVLSLRNLDAGLDGMIAAEQCRRASDLDARIQVGRIMLHEERTCA